MKSFIKSKFYAIIGLLDQAVSSGGNFVIGILLGRFLGLYFYGVFALGLMLVLFLSSIQQALILNPAMTFYPQESESQKRSYMRILLGHQVLYTGIALIGIWIFVYSSGVFFPDWSLFEYAPEMLLFTLGYLFHDFFRKAFFILETGIKAFWIDCCCYGLQIGGIVYYYYSGQLNVEITFILVGLSYCISAALGSLLMGLTPQFGRQTFTLLKKHWAFSSWLTATALLQWFAGNFFILVAGSTLGALAVGAVRIGQNVVGVLNVLFLALENIVPVKTAYLLKAGGKKQLLSYLKKVSLVGGVAVLLCTAGLALVAEPIIEMLYGEIYTSYAYVIQLFALLYVFVFVGLPLRFLIRTLERTKDIFISYVLAAIFSFLLANTFVEQWHISGVVLGLIASQIIMQAWYLFSMRKEFNWKFS